YDYPHNMNQHFYHKRITVYAHNPPAVLSGLKSFSIQYLKMLKSGYFLLPLLLPPPYFLFWFRLAGSKSSGFSRYGFSFGFMFSIVLLIISTSFKLLFPYIYNLHIPCLIGVLG